MHNIYIKYIKYVHGMCLFATNMHKFVLVFSDASPYGFKVPSEFVKLRLGALIPRSVCWSVCWSVCLSVYPPKITKKNYKTLDVARRR